MCVKKKTGLTRRDFLRKSALGAAVFPYIIPSLALGADGAVAPSERITMGCIGLGGQGSGNMGAFLQDPRVQVVAVCDEEANGLLARAMRGPWRI